jgi:predicted transcriptional regulator
MATPHTVYLPVKVSPQIREKLDGLARALRKNRSETLRALILGATLASFPRSWREIDPDEKQLIEMLEGR